MEKRKYLSKLSHKIVDLINEAEEDYPNIRFAGAIMLCDPETDEDDSSSPNACGIASEDTAATIYLVTQIFKSASSSSGVPVEDLIDLLRDSYKESKRKQKQQTSSEAKEQCTKKAKKKDNPDTIREELLKVLPTLDEFDEMSEKDKLKICIVLAATLKSLKDK